MAPMADDKKLELEDRPTVGQVIAITRQIIREERWTRRLARTLVRLKHMDWTAWRFRQRMRFARIRNADATAILQAEIDRVAEITNRANAKLEGKSQHRIRGKVWLPRGVFIVKKPIAPDNVDIVWPRARR